jgi:hypothetical protein
VGICGWLRGRQLDNAYLCAVHSGLTVARVRRRWQPVDRIFGTRGTGVTCWDPTTETETTYLAGTPINQVAVAPDGTTWAVGGYAGDNGGLYRITPD